MSSPLYDINEPVYLRESAALGRLEPMRISGVHLGQNGWLYTVNANMSPPSAGGLLDRRSNVSTNVLYFTENEFITLCEALVLIETNTKAAYELAKSQRQLLCPDVTTGG